MTLELEKKPISESPPSRIEDIVARDKRLVTATVKTVLTDPEQITYFREMLALAQTDLNSGKARFGVNQRRTSPFEMQGNAIYYQADIYPFMESFVREDWDFGAMIDSGMEVGKIYITRPENALAVSELDELVRNRKIIVAEGARINEDGTVSLPLQPFSFEPDERKYSQTVLRYVLERRIPRRESLAYQKKVDVSEIIVPAHDGIITRTTIFAGHYEIVVEDPQHSDANIRSRHSDEFFYIELVGEDTDVKKTHVNVRIYRPEKVAKRKVIIPGVDLKDMSNIDELLGQDPADHLKHHPSKLKVGVISEDTKPQWILTDSKLKTGYSHLEREIEKREGTLVLRRFPSPIDFSHFDVWAHQGLLKSLVFTKAPRFDYFFKSADLVRMDQLSEAGTTVIWYHPRLYNGVPQIYHRGWFMPAQGIPGYDEVVNTGRMLAVYGSGGAGTEVGQKVIWQVCDIIDACAEYHSAIMGVVTGGGPNVMAAANQHALERGHISGAAYWNIPSESPNNLTIFHQYFDNTELQARQNHMYLVGDIVIVAPGGLGTSNEIGIEAVPIKLGLDDKAMFFVDTKFWDSYRTHLDFLMKDGRVDEAILKNMFFVDNGQQCTDYLNQYYHTKKSTNIAMSRRRLHK